TPVSFRLCLLPHTHTDTHPYSVLIHTQTHSLRRTHTQPLLLLHHILSQFTETWTRHRHP
ncbi:hypothetical protein BDP81DRAFT_420292, partial [Colletotrichum phormii]